MKTIILIVATGAALVFLYLNPTFFNGLIDHVKKPVEAWVANPEKAFDEHAPWQLDPEDLKKKSGSTGDSVLDKKDSGNDVKANDPGEKQKAQDPGKNQSSKKDLGQGLNANDPGKQINSKNPQVYVNKNDPGQKWSVGSDPGEKFVIEEPSTQKQEKKSSKKEASSKDLRYTQDEFNVYAIAVQKAK